jgi:hypothetical protein
MSMFHRLEKYGTNHIDGDYICVSFETEHRGIWQCRWSESGMGEFPSEPPFESLRESEQAEIKEVGLIVFKLTHDNIPNI